MVALEGLHVLVIRDNKFRRTCPSRSQNIQKNIIRKGQIEQIELELDVVVCRILKWLVGLAYASVFS